MALKLEGWNLLFYVFDGLKAKSQCYWYDCLFSPSFFFLFLSRVIKIPHIRIFPPRMTSYDKERKEEASSANPHHLLSYPRFIMKILLIYVMKLCQLCGIFCFLSVEQKKNWGGDGYYHLWVNEWKAMPRVNSGKCIKDVQGDNNSDDDGIDWDVTCGIK